MTKEPLFRPGFELSTWPYMRVARAQQHAQDLVARYFVWVVGAQPTVDVTYSEDRLTAYVKVGIAGAPTNELALCVADCLHNLRASLDGLVWELAHLDGATPKTPGRILFPICETKTDWADKTRHLETVPAVALERIEQVQPYHDTAPNPRLLVLHRLDIQQKHKQGVRASHQPKKVDLHDAVCTFLEAVELGNPDDVLSVTAPPDNVDQDGSVRFEITSKFPIASLLLPVRLNSQLFMESEFGRVALPTHLETLVLAVKEVHEFVMGVSATGTQVA